MEKTSALSAPFYVLIAAAGSGRRFSSDIPKQYTRLLGKPLLRHTVEKFLTLCPPSMIRIIIDPDHAKWYHDAVRGLDLPPPVSGGKTRKESVYKGLVSFSKEKYQDRIVIHDAARPLVRPGDILRLVESLQENPASTLACPVQDTLKRCSKGRIADDVSRDNLYGLQTPQGFHYGIIRRAHEETAGRDDFTDDTGVVAALGIPVHIVPGHPGNLKITRPEDLETAEALLRQEIHMETRTGSGFDVHAFKTQNDGRGTVRLGGIDIPFEKSLCGHSDADVALHALTDAILGALALGDIGDHFPPSDPQYKDMDSTVFLEKACDLAHARGGRIISLDLTLICERPKIGPHKEKIRARIAEITGLDVSRVGVKATTTERLGFTGRGEGIAAQALATVEVSGT